MRIKELVEKGGVLTRNGTYRLGMTTYAAHRCTWCGAECWVRRGDLSRRGIGFCGNKCSQAWQSESSYGSRHLNANGYWVRHIPDHPNADRRGNVLEHRFIMAEHIGRPLRPNEVVHHKDGNRANNALDNLELVEGHAEHQKRHFEEGDLYQLGLKGLRRCSTCREVQPLDEFTTAPSNPHGRHNVCRKCGKEAYERRNPNRLTREEGLRRAHQRKWEGTEDHALFHDGKRRCKHCKDVKALDDFVRNPDCRGGRTHECKACRKGRLARHSGAA